MAEYNKLTNDLLSHGFTVDNHPNYVKVAGGIYGKEPLQNIYGGFEYRQWYCEEFVYKTGCGMYVMGNSVNSGMGYMGINWSHENDCPVIRCPYDKAQCELNNPVLHGEVGGALFIQCWCECHKTSDHYCYENSFEKAEKERQEEKDRKYKEYSDAHKGRVCINHMYFNEGIRAWTQKFEPYACSHRCFSSFCPILGRELDKKKGNVYYDLKKSGTRHDGTLFEGQEWINIKKGIRFFEQPVSMDICNSFVKIQPDKIYERCWWNHGSTNQLFDKTFKMEILNIRAESKPSRDLMQDLQDLKSGIEVNHASDLEKKNKEAKKERRKEASEKKKQKLEKKILELGYDGMESIDKVRANKWLTEERLMELHIIRRQKIKKESEEPIQLSLYELVFPGMPGEGKVQYD